MKHLRIISAIITAIFLLAVPPVTAQTHKKGTTSTTQAGAGKGKGKSAASGKSTANSRTKAAAGDKTAGASRKKGKPRGTATRRETAGETTEDVKRRQEAAQKEIALTKEQIRENDLAVRRGLNDLGKLQTDIDAGKKKLAAATSQVRNIDGKINIISGNITKEEKDLQRLRAEYLKAVKKMRLKKKETSSIAFIFASRNFNEALRRMRYLREFAAWRDKQTSDIDAKVKSLRREKELLARTKVEKENAVKAESSAQNALQAQYRQQDAVVVKLKENGAALRTHLSAKQKEANVLKGQVAALIAQEQRKAEAERQAREKAELARREEEARKERQREIAREETRSAASGAETASAESGKSDAAVSEGNLKVPAPPKAKPSQTDRRRNLRDNPVKQQDDKKTSRQKEKEQKQQEKKNKKIAEDKKKQADKNSRTDRKGNSDYAEARKRTPRGQSGAPTATSSASPDAASSSKAIAASSSAAGNFEKMKGSLPRPVAGAFKITSQFGVHSLPDLPDVKYDNPGIDAEVAAGASAQAVYGGKVSGVYVIPGYSTVVIVNHGNYYTVYGNIQSPTVRVGDNVKQGQSLGRLAPAEEDPSHSSIHFEVWHNRDKQNPAAWIR